MAPQSDYDQDAELGQEISSVGTITIGASDQIISSRKKRKVYFIRNTSLGGQIISLSLSNTNIAVAGSGIVLNPNDTIVDSNSDNYNCWRGDIHAISSAAGGTIAITERAS